MVSPRQIAVDLSVVSVEDVGIDRWRVVDRPGPSRGASASAISSRWTQRLYGWLRPIKATPTSPFIVFIDLHYTQELGIHSYLLEQHFYTHQSITSGTKERSSKKELLMCV